MNETQEPIQEFWRWFQEHHADFDALTDTAAPFWDVATSQLQLLDKHLRFELSGPNGTARELIITAEGHAQAFPVAEAIVALAPQTPGWQFIALKPPKRFDFTFAYQGIPFEPRSMSYRVLESNSPP